MTVKYVFNPTTGKLDATDKVAFNGEVNLGTAAAPSIFFTGDPNTGIYSPGADQVAISTGGTGRLLVDASGRVGIGTFGPNVLLHLDSAPAGTGSAGVIGFGDASNYRFAEIEGYREGASFAGSLIFRTQTSGGISAAGSERLRITSAGLVGIGTSSPTTALTVGGVTPALSLTYNFPLNNTVGALISSVRFGDGDPGREATATISAHVDSLWSAGSGPTALRFNTAPGGSVTALPRMTIDSAGRVGIGTTSPNNTLHLAAAANHGILIERTGAGPGSVRLNVNTNGDADLFASNSFGIQSGGSAPITFCTNGNYTERARIDSSGRVLVGTSSQQQLGGRDQVLQFRTASYAAASVVGTIDNWTGPWFTLAKAKGGTTPTAVGPGDQLGVFNFVGYDGTSWGSIGASIEVWVDGATGANDMPCRLVFCTTADGAASPTERMRITSTGQVRLAGAGITFNGDTATANELDDYEEGTFTPTVSGGSTAGTGTYSTQAGKYVKIGGMVFAEVALEWSAHTGTGNMFLTGLPFTSAANEAGSGISLGRVSNLAIAANSYLTGYIIASNTAVALRAIPTGGGAESSVTLDTAAAINYSITYMVV